MKCELVRARDFLSFFKEQCAQTRSLRIAVAYLRKGGIEAIREPLRKFLTNHGCSCVFVVGLSNQYITQPEAVKELLSISRDFPGSLKLRYSSRSSFHPKIFLFAKPHSYTALVGSSNLTGGGTWGNLEANVAISGRSQSNGIFPDLLKLFSEIVKSTVSAKLNRNRWKEYNRDFEGAKSAFKRKELRPSLKPTGDLGEPGSFPDTDEPDVMQDIEDIEELSEVSANDVVWKISPDRNASQWREWQRQTNERTNEGVIAIGWENLGDPSRLTRGQVAALARKRRWPKPNYVAKQVRTFFNLMRPKNLVVAYGKSSMLDIGIITGPPKHLAKSAPVIFANQIPVKWFKIGRKLLSKRQRYFLCYPQDTLHRIKDEATLQRIKRSLPSRKVPKDETKK